MQQCQTDTDYRAKYRSSLPTTIFRSYLHNLTAISYRHARDDALCPWTHSTNDSLKKPEQLLEAVHKQLVYADWLIVDGRFYYPLEVPVKEKMTLHPARDQSQEIIHLFRTNK